MAKAASATAYRSRSSPARLSVLSSSSLSSRESMFWKRSCQTKPRRLRKFATARSVSSTNTTAIDKGRPVPVKRVGATSTSVQVELEFRRRHQTRQHQLLDDAHPPASPNLILTEAMATAKSSLPQWVAQLESPPPAKSKVPGIADPPGFSTGQAVASKVRITIRTGSIQRLTP